jgi:hypothetical protein
VTGNDEKRGKDTLRRSVREHRSALRLLGGEMALTLEKERKSHDIQDNLPNVKSAMPDINLVQGLAYCTKWRINKP